MKREIKHGNIYGLIDPRTEQVRYVGWTINSIESRLYGHISEARKQGKNSHKLAWIRLLLKSGLEPNVVLLEQVEFTTWAEAEKRWIVVLKEQGNKLTNLTIGGEGSLGYSHSPSAREKIRIARAKQVITEETRRKVSLAQKGKPKLKAQQRTPEERALVSEAISRSKKGIKHSKPHTAEHIQHIREARLANGTAKGYHHIKKRSEDYGKLMWESRRQNGTDKHSDETKHKLSEFWKEYHKTVGHPRGMLGKKASDMTRLQMRHSMRSTLQVKRLKKAYPTTYGEFVNVVNY